MQKRSRTNNFAFYYKNLKTSNLVIKNNPPSKKDNINYHVMSCLVRQTTLDLQEQN